LPEGIKGEELNVLVGSQPVKEKAAKQKVKLWVLDYLNKKYGMVEEDFVSADLEIVPAGVPRDIGFDKSMIGAYGQDDRICVYTSVQAIVDIPSPKRTSVCVLYDREEIGSEGFSGARSKFFENAVGDIIGLKDPDYRDSYLRKVLENSRALSSDVNAGINPIFPDVHEKRNAAKLGYGLVITKFTGSGGKYGASEASAEFVGEIRNMLNKSKIPWQSAELGKVDEGGGGTVAKHIAMYNMDVLDCGPPVLSMHSPFEISSKLDVYFTYEAYRAFYKS
jgi:aspartyl aminopeptidase